MGPSSEMGCERCMPPGGARPGVASPTAIAYAASRDDLAEYGRGRELAAGVVPSLRPRPSRLARPAQRRTRRASWVSWPRGASVWPGRSQAGLMTGRRIGTQLVAPPFEEAPLIALA